MPKKVIDKQDVRQYLLDHGMSGYDLFRRAMAEGKKRPLSSKEWNQAWKDWRQWEVNNHWPEYLLPYLIEEKRREEAQLRLSL